MCILFIISSDMKFILVKNTAFLVFKYQSWAIGWMRPVLLWCTVSDVNKETYFYLLLCIISHFPQLAEWLNYPVVKMFNMKLRSQTSKPEEERVSRERPMGLVQRSDVTIRLVAQTCRVFTFWGLHRPVSTFITW